MLVRLLYASRAADDNHAAAIESIMQQSRTHNPERGITGILCYGGDIFMQVLEGGRMEVNELYGFITRDPRHKDVVILKYEEVTERRFYGWTMGQVNIDKINPSVLLKYSSRPVLDPYSVSGDVSIALLEELISTAAIIGRT
ncbi:MAG: BLUF domain-containing protein [Burkholderiales bacterium]|nr:BLUF domain-containing protein [Rhodocyclaceae bacterium]